MEFCLYVGADGIWRLLLHFLCWFGEKVWNSVQWIWTVKYAIITNKSVVLLVVLYAIKLAKIFHKLSHVVSKWWVFEFRGLRFSDKLYHLQQTILVWKDSLKGRSLFIPQAHPHVVPSFPFELSWLLWSHNRSVSQLTDSMNQSQWFKKIWNIEQ